MTAPTGQISLLDIQNEFGGSAPISLSEYYQLAGYVPGGQGVPGSGVISFNDLRGKTKVVDVTAAASVTLYNVVLRDALIAAGWDQNAPAIYRIPATTKIFSKRTDTAALIVSGSFPGGLTIVNSGKILGKGGQGGYNFGGFGAGGGPGAAGGAAIDVRTACTINNLGTIGGGGGGGGAAGSPSAQASYFVTSGGGGGGAGGDAGAAGTSYHYVAPLAGNEVTGGAGGVGYASVQGGKGGDLGLDGAAGPQGENGGGGGGPGGRGGRAVVGSEYVTWTAYGTIKGGIRESTWCTIGGFYPNEPLTTTSAAYGTWGPLAYGSNSYYMYQLIYGHPNWGHYPTADYADDDYYGPLAFNAGNSQTFDWYLFGKSIKMTGSYNDSGLFVSTNSYVGVRQQVYDLAKSNGVAWTIECWVYPTENNAPTGYACIINLNNTSSYTGFRLYRKNAGSLYVQSDYGAWESAGSKIPLNAWTHVCVERSGNQTRIYINGIWQYTDPAPPNSALIPYGPNHINSYKIGSLSQYTGYEWCGYISNVRIVANTAVYNTGTSSFTVPTQPLTAITGTVLLACRTSSASQDIGPYNLTGRATGSGTASGGYARDNQVAGSIAPSATGFHPFASGNNYSVFFKGPGTTTPYTGYGILEFPGKISDTSLVTNPLINLTSPFKPYTPAIDRIMICAGDMKSGYNTMESGCAPYYNSTADYTHISYNGVKSSVNPATSGWGTVRNQWQLQFYNPSLFGGRMVVGIHTAPIGSVGPFGTALTAWASPGYSAIGSADGTEYLDFSDKINGPGQSVILVGDSNGRNWKAYSGHFKWSNVTNKAFSTEPSLLNYDKT